MRRPGLQVWLVATLIAVGALASLSVLISILPTFESSLRDAHATATARQLRSDLDQQLSELPPQLPASGAALNALATAIGSNVGAQVRIISAGLTTHTGTSVGCCALLDHLHAQYGSRLPGNAAFVADDSLVADFLIFAAVAFPILDRTENVFGKQAVLFRLLRPVVDRLRLLYFSV